MPNRPTRRTTLLLGLTLAAAPATALAATRYAPHADAATSGLTAAGLDDPRRRTSRCSWCPARRTPRWTGRRSTSTSRTSATAAATPPGSSASAPAPATCSTSSALHRPQARQRAGQVSARPAQGRTAATRTPAWTRTTPRTGDRRQGHGRSSRPERRARPRLLQPGRVSQGKSDGLRALGQFAYYDAIVMHGAGSDATSFGGIRRRALRKAKPPAQGGDEMTYLNAFLDARVGR